MFTVGGFARLAGVSAKVLRAYDAEGLFAPAWVDPSSGYRYYSPAQLPSLRRIQALRDVGLSRAEIGALVGGGADLRATLERRRHSLEAERRELDRRLAMLEIRVGDTAASGADVVIRSLTAEIVAAMDPAVCGHDIAAAFHELESRVRDLGARAHRPPGALPDEDRIFVPLRRQIPSTDRIGVRRLPATQAATILHQGRYETLPQARADLLAWIVAAGHAPSGPLRILYLQFGAEADLRLPTGWTVEREADFVTELQQPIASTSDATDAVAREGQSAGQPASFENVS
ncbi:MAG TPA: MerR family transcriptional regulator [Candidatus Limnocylindrales bacterium]